MSRDIDFYANERISEKTFESFSKRLQAFLLQFASKNSNIRVKPTWRNMFQIFLNHRFSEKKKTYKYSVHITNSSIMFPENRSAKEFTKCFQEFVLQKLPQKNNEHFRSFVEGIDLGVYQTNQSWRLPYNSNGEKWSSLLPSKETNARFSWENQMRSNFCFGFKRCVLFVTRCVTCVDLLHWMQL